MNTVIDHLINEESNRASDSATRGTVKLRVFLKIARLMGIPLQTIYDTQDLVRIDPSLSKAIEILWNGGSPIEMDSLNQNWIVVLRRNEKSSSTEDEELLQKFLSRDFAKPVDISKILSALEKRFVESNLVRRELGYVFAADGLLDDDEPICFERYFDHLAIPKTLGEPIDDDHPIEDPMEAHVRAVRTIYRDVKYVTPERIGATLKRLLKVDNDELPPKKRGDNRSSASSESSSSSSSVSSDGNDHWQDHYDKYIADQYKKLVGKKFNLIIQWMRERLRHRKAEEMEQLRKRAIATKRKRVTFESCDPKILIKDMTKKSQTDSQTDSPTAPENGDFNTEVISPAAAPAAAAAAVATTSSTNVTKVVSIDPKRKTTKKKTKPKKPEESEGTKRKKSEKIKQSKKVKTTTEEAEKESTEVSTEPIECEKESDKGSESKGDHE